MVWQYTFWSFQWKGTKLERFLAQNQHTQMKLLNIENWHSGDVSKSASQNLTFNVNFLCQTNMKRLCLKSVSVRKNQFGDI